MNNHLNKKHVIDMIFPVALFFVFAASSLLVILFAASIYQRTTVLAEGNYQSRTALAYVTGKIHQGDENGGVSLGRFEGHDSVIIQQTYGTQRFVTYIYEEDGILRELFLLEGKAVSGAEGREIMEIHELQMEQIQPGLFRLSCAGKDGEEIRTVVSVLSQ